MNLTPFLPVELKGPWLTNFVACVGRPWRQTGSMVPRPSRRAGAELGERAGLAAAKPYSGGG